MTHAMRPRTLQLLQVLLLYTVTSTPSNGHVLAHGLLLLLCSCAIWHGRVARHSTTGRVACTRPCASNHGGLAVTMVDNYGGLCLSASAARGNVSGTVACMCGVLSFQRGGVEP